MKLNRLVNENLKRNARKWGTRIDKAEKIARDELFTPGGGDRPNVPNLLIIFTDGRSTGEDKSDFTPFIQLTEGLEVRSLYGSVLVTCSYGSPIYS